MNLNREPWREGGEKRSKFQQRTTEIWETKSNAPGSKKQTKYPINKINVEMLEYTTRFQKN